MYAEPVKLMIAVLFAVATALTAVGVAGIGYGVTLMGVIVFDGSEYAEVPFPLLALMVQL